MDRKTDHPVPHAINIAKAVQKAVSPDTVLLFGSRATGNHRETSDLDLIIITGQRHHLSARLHAEEAARDYMAAHPPNLDLGIISMSKKDFLRCSQAKMHPAGQAKTYGLNMSGEDLEGLEHEHDYEDNYPDHWPETSRRIRRAQESNYNLNHFVETDYYDKTLIGHTTERAIEHALKGWLSSLDDDGHYGHRIEAAWRKIQETEKYILDTLPELREAIQDVFDFTTFHDPGPNSPDRTSNWLTLYAVIYDYDLPQHEMTREQELLLRDKIDLAVNLIVARTHQLSNTSDLDVYPDGLKPWQR